MIKKIFGYIIGILELIGFRYPVEKYKSQVSDSLWRGSRDTDLEMFKLIVNLCAEKQIDKTKIPVIRIPIIDNTIPTKEQVEFFLEITRNDKWFPIYVHCEAGKGRTGIMVAIYRVKQQGWLIEDAIIEAKKFGLSLEHQENFIKNYCK